MIRGLNDISFVVCALLVEILDGCNLVWMVLVREFGKERKNGETVNVFLSTWYHGPNDCMKGWVC